MSSLHWLAIDVIIGMDMFENIFDEQIGTVDSAAAHPEFSEVRK